MDGEEKRCSSPASTSHPAEGLSLDGVPYRHIPWQRLALVLMLLILSLPGPRQSRMAFHRTLNHFNHNTKDLSSHQGALTCQLEKGDGGLMPAAAPQALSAKVQVVNAY